MLQTADDTHALTEDNVAPANNNRQQQAAQQIFGQDDNNPEGAEEGQQDDLPILYAEPNQWDIEQSAIIKKILKEDYNQYEENIKTRTTVMKELNEIIRDWIKECGRRQGIDDDVIQTWGGKIFEFGSYRLDVHTPGTDIDALVVAPVHIDRDQHFFEVLPEILQRNKEQDMGVQKLVLVREAFVPCIKMIYKHVDIDLLFARIEWKEVGDNIKSLKDDTFLRHCDSESIRSLNGRRVTDAIMEHIPNMDTFKLTLRCVKLWAKNRGIYSNVFGYCGGVAWAILVAYVCKQNPKLETCQLLDTFFQYYRKRRWVHDNPIFLGEIKNDPSQVAFKIPDPNLFYRPSDKDYFPIITPAFPSMNSTYNVSLTTRNIMISEMEKAMLITRHLMSRQNTSRVNWKRLFKSFPFFKAYRHFIQIQILSKTEDHHEKWKGYIESKIRKLLQFLESSNNFGIYAFEFRPWPKSYNLQDKVAQGFTHDDTYYFGLRLKKQGHAMTKDDDGNPEDAREEIEQIDLTPAREKFFKKLKDFIHDKQRSDYKCYYELLTKGEVDVDVRMFKRENLPDKVRPKMQSASDQNVIPAPTDLIDGMGGAMGGFGNYADIYDQQPTNLLGQRRNFSMMQENQGYDDPNRNQIALEDIEAIEELNNHQYM